MAKKNYLSYPNPEFVPTVDSLPDGTLVAYDAASQLWATFESGQIFQKDANGNWMYVFHTHNNRNQVGPRRTAVVQLNFDGTDFSVVEGSFRFLTLP